MAKTAKKTVWVNQIGLAGSVPRYKVTKVKNTTRIQVDQEMNKEFVDLQISKGIDFIISPDDTLEE